MAARKSSNLLPGVFQTDTNQKFLSATVDQLISEPRLTKVNGYIGRKFAPTYKSGDNYITEISADRQNYQLEPSLLVKDESGQITFFASYDDFLNKIKYYGGFTDKQSRLFEQEYYSFDPGISYDAFVNFSQYYWLPDGPEAVSVNTTTIELVKNFRVVRNVASDRYDFYDNNIVNNSITLARGGTYTFTVNQPGIPFWIQTELGIDGAINATPAISSRDVLGVENNGTDSGVITFRVPQSDAQDRFVKMKTVYNVDYAFSMAYADIHNSRLSEFLEKFPEYYGITNQFVGKTLVLVDQNLLTSRGEAAWSGDGIYDEQNYNTNPFDSSDIIPENQRSGVWQILYSESGVPEDPIIKLVPVLVLKQDQKVFVKSGIRASREFYQDYDGLLKPMPLLSNLQDTLYFQDGDSAGIYGFLKVVNPANDVIDVDREIIGKKLYTSPNGVKFTNGLKVRFGSDVSPVQYQNQEFYVERVGRGIHLVPVDILVRPEAYNDEIAQNYSDEIFPEYITINRDSIDLNAWSRNNRWFHIDVIIKTAAYNNRQPALDQRARAQRPIIQFDVNFQLFNNGRTAKKPIDILDVTTSDPFNAYDGQIIESIFGIKPFDGMRILFSAAEDPLVRNKIYVINLIQYDLDDSGLPTGPRRIALSIAEDGDAAVWDSVVVTQGQYRGVTWWFNGNQWVQGQQKTQLQQEPLFDIIDSDGRSLSEFYRSTFNGTRLFGYVRNAAGVTDKILGFALKYRNFGTQGDIEFENYYDTDVFSYVENQLTQSDLRISDYGFLYEIQSDGELAPRNNWRTAVESSRQYQILNFTYDGINNSFQLDVVAAESTSVPSLKVYKNNVFLQTNEYQLVDNKLTVTASLATNDKIDVLIYSRKPSNIGYYEVPSNLNLNAQNIDLNQISLGQVRNHLVALSQNSTELVGNILSTNNLRDIDITSQGGTILQHSAPVTYSMLFLMDKSANFIDALRFAQLEYSKFKNKFLELAQTLGGIESMTPEAGVDAIMVSLTNIKNISFPWYYSDMVPYGTLKRVVNGQGYTVFDPLVRSYEINGVFNDQVLSSRAVLVYLKKYNQNNFVQLINRLDYTFDQTRPAVTIESRVELDIDDVIKIVEYDNTDGNYIPETPTKLGLYPRYVPEIFLDNTYRQPINVIRGHDGSIIPAFNDYRDNLILELEKRIYNNIKLPETNINSDIMSLTPGKFRSSDYTLGEVTQLISRSFLAWVGNNRLDFSTNQTFASNDSFTWNYSGSQDRIDGEYMPGNWRACYQYYYDTQRPHLTPWEMLGFTSQPDWWQDYYGPAPYTGANQVLWDDLEAGRIRQGFRSLIDQGQGPGIDPTFARPGLSQVIPVDEHGILLSPAQILARSTHPKSAASAWKVGDFGPVEWAWRSSSDYPFAVQRAMALGKPARYFGLLIDTYGYKSDSLIDQYLTPNKNHLRQTDVKFNGDITQTGVVRSAGYINWIIDYLKNQGLDPVSKLSYILKNYQVNLAYKMSGFTDKKFIRVLAEQSSPSSTNDSIMIPDENYQIHLHKSTPIQKLTYSAVIVQKTTNGYSVKGYNLNNPFFTIIPSQTNNNSTKIQVLTEIATIFKDYQRVKLTVPYGYEFKNPQQVVDFLISYERYLLSQGFTFNGRDPDLRQPRNWKLSAQEFLFWSQQGWGVGSILVLSPTVNDLALVTKNAVVDEISNSQIGSRILDQNFKLVKNNNYNVVRTPTDFKISLSVTGSTIGFVELDLVQYEHALIFDNLTVFNDIIYKPELGNRQYRLKLIGQKTSNWDGSLNAPGFVYSSDQIQTWQPGRDYQRGELVQYKAQYWVALEFVIATTDFAWTKWKQIEQSQVRVGMLPNLSTLAVKGLISYDNYGQIQDSDQLKYSYGLIGYKPRQYLTDLGLSDATQIELYKGYIKQKGTENAVNQLTKSKFNNINSDIKYYEEWAVRVGEYGALNMNPYVEIALDETNFGVNPSLARFVEDTSRDQGDGITVFNKTQLYGSSGHFSGFVALNRSVISDISNDIPTAGYVNIEDIDATLFDLSYYSYIGLDIDYVGSGYTIWCARDFAGDWNVYRVTETDNHIISVANSLDNYVSFTTQAPHQLTIGDVFLVKGLNSAFDGFYRVHQTQGLDQIIALYQGDPANYQNLTSLDGFAMLLRLDSMRFRYMEDARIYGLNNPLHGWKAGDKIWIDVDAATTTANGQSQDTESGTWKVYEKTMPWGLQQNLSKASGEYVTNDGFGTSVKMNADGLYAVVGSPKSLNTGTVTVFNKNASGVLVEGEQLLPKLDQTLDYGAEVSLATERLAIGAPGSVSNTGRVFVYNRPTGTSTFLPTQVLSGPANSAGRFGSSLTFDEVGNWLYVGAPDEDRVYVYGLNPRVSVKTQSLAINSPTNIITLSFSPDVPNNAESLLITGVNRIFLPDIDYTVTGRIITFASNLSSGDYEITQRSYYTLVKVLTGPAGSEFGYAVSASLDGAQLAVGAPNDSVTVDDAAIPGAGAVYVYDRSIEAFNTITDATDTEGVTYQTRGNIGLIYRVTINNTEVSDYVVAGDHTLKFKKTPVIGQVIYVETNEFKLLEKLIGIDSLEGGLTAIQENCRFGTSLTICSNNCAIYVGAPNYDAGTQYNTGAVWKFHNRGRLYGTNTGSTRDPVFTPGDTIRLDNFEITVTGTSLDDLVQDINNASVLGVTATNQNGHLRLDSDRTVAKNLLRILSGENNTGDTDGVSNVYAAAGLSVFAFMQIIVTPYRNANEQFGKRVVLARNAYMLVIASDGGTTRHYTTFDQDQTYIDDRSTGIFDSVVNSGSVYIYELYDDPRNEVEHPGRYAFAQQLDPGQLRAGDRFGAAIDVVGRQIVVTAPTSDLVKTDAGAVYVFNNPTGHRGWHLIRYQEPRVDIETVNRMYLYDTISHTILTNLEFIDPAKGKILGLAEQEITFKTPYDPAYYNRGASTQTDLDRNLYWGPSQIGQVWWNLDNVRYLDYEQGDLSYRSANWGRVFPGSTVEVCEWVESDVLPSQYSGDGQAKHADDSAYVEIMTVDPVTNIITSKYYYWVTGKTELDYNIPFRKLPLNSIRNLIENPRNQDIAYAALIRNNAVVFYNLGKYLSARNTILHLDYELQPNDSLIHSEYDLLQVGNVSSAIPEKIVNRMIDSLSGINNTGANVPDPTLPPANRYGISIRPRQTMFVDRLQAMSDLVDFVNSIFITKPITRQYDLRQLMSEEPIPDVKYSEYDHQVETRIELDYIDTVKTPVGYRVLVKIDTTQDGLWVIYQLRSDRTWQVTRVQRYKTELYWDFVDWYAEGYNITDKIEYVVETLVDALALPARPGDEILIRVNRGLNNVRGWNLISVSDNGEFQVVGIENGTIQLKSSLYNLTDNQLGFDGRGFDSSRYDQNPNIEIRQILAALKDDIFVNELRSEFNNLFFVMINYLMTEQKYVDWIFKTSFISVAHKLRDLNQYPNYVKDNQTYYLDYINEIKPYATKVREYLIKYAGDDNYAGDVTDFDLPPYYDRELGQWRSPDGEYIEQDRQLWATGYLADGTLINPDYPQWYQHRHHQIVAIVVEDSGQGYTSEPTITIVGGGGNVIAARARARIDFDTGQVIDIEIVSSGNGYASTPTVVINGSCERPARAYAVLKNLQVRSFDSTLKFDRINYTSLVKEWAANTVYAAGDILTYAVPDGGTLVRTAYRVLNNMVTGAQFDPTNLEICPADYFTNANDRIIAYYQPLTGAVGRDLRKLISGIDYPGVGITGLTFDRQPGFDGLLDGEPFDAVEYDEDGNPILSRSAVDTIIRSNYLDSNLGLRPEDIDVDGGAYVDTYSSHAPEELVPGIVFDTLNLKVYTKVALGTTLLGYRIFVDMLGVPHYTRIASAYSTKLTRDLNLNDQRMYVADATVLARPDPTTATPGVVFVNAERITYYRNYATEVRFWVPNVSYRSDTVLSHGNIITFSGPVTANIGDTIHQPDSGANIRVVSNVVSSLEVPAQYTLSQGRIVGNVLIMGSGTVQIIAAGQLNASNLSVYPTDTRTGYYRSLTELPAATSLDFDNVEFIDDINILTQLRRGTQGTKAGIQSAGLAVLDAGVDQNIPGINITATTITGNVTYHTTSTPPYELLLSGNVVPELGSYITQSSSGANVTVTAISDSPADTIQLSGVMSALPGDYITQPSTGANALIRNSSENQIYLDIVYTAGQFGIGSGNVFINGKNTGVYPTAAKQRGASRITVTYNTPTPFDFTDATIELSGSVTVNSGDLIGQLVGGAELRASRTTIDSNRIYTVYQNTNDLVIGQGNIQINGQPTSVYPINRTYNSTISNEITIDGVRQQLICPVSVSLVGGTDANGNVTLTTGTKVLQEKIWYSPGVGTAANGEGFDTTSTEQVLFLKQRAAELLTSSELSDEGDEDIVNILITEDGKILSAEFGGYQ